MDIAYEEVIKGIYLGSGVDGAVYQYGMGRVVKLSRCAIDAKACREIAGHTMRNVVKIFSVHDIVGPYDEKFTAILMEGLVPLDQGETSAAESIPQQIWMRKRFNWEEALSSTRHKKLIKNIRTGLRALARRGLHHNDLHSGNIMRSTTGTYKIIDMSIMRWDEE